MHEKSREVARLLISIQAVVVTPKKPFTYTSGLQGPIYCDNRKVLSHVTVRDKIIQYFLEVIREKNMVCDSYAGLATAGIPHAALIADRLKSPMIYIRAKAKEHGKQNQIEGDYKSGDKILLIEDLVNQAGSLKTAYYGAKEAGLCPVGCLAIVDYQMESAKNIIRELKLPFFALTNLESIIDVCFENRDIDEHDKVIVTKWQKDPSHWKLA
ncbi:MAG: orotate phosphoribosyltransferase [Bdellovibrionales bacterium RIFOXYB1_FULL_37_110]|nr:MAG: orotate phosphoribosyltransferase [Bdellovibrionales bacterium RIFOXYC1_FULL_37_79]OFZ60174.1 MAG: orotate phosphoribosyltransferase [Bdellovibrionales bacterium RIFOXYB1_FULL_37_110]OFZ64332.1 MAG: orotate phosphoribosyltransferase [Bdellovibrionales bacterium RIFOXYD1_FULL_36_51]OFZ67840.1 MAG: orotate phosphoribosyltransferase [Bdellovibrionales bacterium RIFOXYB2_FULL_36_6]